MERSVQRLMPRGHTPMRWACCVRAGAEMPSENGDAPRVASLRESPHTQLGGRAYGLDESAAGEADGTQRARRC